MKNFFTTLLILITLTISTTGFADNSNLQSQSKKTYQTLTFDDSLTTNLNAYDEFSCIDYRFMKPNTNCIITNDYKIRFGYELKQTIKFFYGENTVESIMEFKKPEDKEEIIKQCEYRYKNKFFEPLYTKGTLDSNLYYETYEWKNWAGKVTLNYTKHPILGTHLTLSILKDHVIKDPNYNKPNLKNQI